MGVESTALTLLSRKTCRISIAHGARVLSCHEWQMLELCLYGL
jgi:hypothetical protein